MANFEHLEWAALAASVLVTVTFHMILYQKLSRMSSDNAIFRGLMLKKGEGKDPPYSILRDQLALLTHAVEDLLTSSSSIANGVSDEAVVEALLSLRPEETEVGEMKKRIKTAELISARAKERTTKLESLLRAKKKEFQEYERNCPLTTQAGEASGTHEGEDKEVDAKLNKLCDLFKEFVEIEHGL